MAGRTVSETYELLEHILLHLPMKDILRARAVSREWQALMVRSLPLKRALFFDCDTNDRVREGLGSAIDNTLASHGPRLKKPFKEIVPLFRVFDPKASAHKTRPWIFKQHMLWSSTVGTIYEFHWPSISGYPKASLPAAMQNIHLARPSPTTVTIGVNFYTSEVPRPYCSNCYNVEAVVQETRGVTLGLIADTFAKLLEHVPGRVSRSEATLSLFIRIVIAPDA